MLPLNLSIAGLMFIHVAVRHLNANIARGFSLLARQDGFNFPLFKRGVPNCGTLTSCGDNQSEPGEIRLMIKIIAVR